MFSSGQGQYTSTPTPSGGALIDSSESDDHGPPSGGSAEATDGRTHHSSRTNRSKKSAKRGARSHASTAGKRPEAGAEASQVGRASRVGAAASPRQDMLSNSLILQEATLNGLSFITLFEESYQVRSVACSVYFQRLMLFRVLLQTSTGYPRTLAEYFRDWDIPEGVGEVRDVKTGIVSYKPTITKRLVGGEKAAERMWRLLYLLGQEGDKFLSAAAASGNYWEVLTEAELTMETLTQYPEFKALYRQVEDGPLNMHFAGHLPGRRTKWDFASLRAGRAAKPRRDPGQFFDCVAQLLASLVRPFIGFLAVRQWLTASLRLRRCSTGSSRSTHSYVPRRRGRWRRTSQLDCSPRRENRRAHGAACGRLG